MQIFIKLKKYIKTNKRNKTKKNEEKKLFFLYNI